MRRLLYAPVSYLETGWFNKVVYPRQQQPKKVRAKTFYGLSFRVGLPAGTDIFLTGGKTHPSEIRVVKVWTDNPNQRPNYLSGLLEHQTSLPIRSCNLFHLIASAAVNEETVKQ